MLIEDGDAHSLRSLLEKSRLQGEALAPREEKHQETGLKVFLALGALATAVAVALGAFGAHALKARLSPDLLGVWQTAVQYHGWHALGLLAVGLTGLHFEGN